MRCLVIVSALSSTRTIGPDRSESRAASRTTSEWSIRSATLGLPTPVISAPARSRAVRR